LPGALPRLPSRVARGRAASVPAHRRIAAADSYRASNREVGGQQALCPHGGQSNAPREQCGERQLCTVKQQRPHPRAHALRLRAFGENKSAPADFYGTPLSTANFSSVLRAYYGSAAPRVNRYRRHHVYIYVFVSLRHVKLLRPMPPARGSPLRARGGLRSGGPTRSRTAAPPGGRTGGPP